MYAYNTHNSIQEYFVYEHLVLHRVTTRDAEEFVCEPSSPPDDMDLYDASADDDE